MNRREQSPARKARIVAAATTLLTKRGLHALSFETVAQEADLSRQLVRYYFKDIDALMVEVSDHLMGEYVRLLVEGVRDVGKEDRLGFFLDFFFDAVEGRPMPEELEVYDALIAYSVGSPALRDRMCDKYRTLGQVIAQELAIAHPALLGRPAEELSFLFVSMMHAHWSFVASLGHSRQHNRLTRKAIDRLIASYLDDPSPTSSLDRPWSRGG